MATVTCIRNIPVNELMKRYRYAERFIAFCSHSPLYRPYI